ncbi:MAG: ECF-type sigma factor, partial [Bacteroidota bacterium]
RRRLGGPATLNTTALLHEAYEKLAHHDGTYASRPHFFRVAAYAMRQILVDYARAQLTAKRGAGEAATTFDEWAVVGEGRPAEVVAIDEALTRLAALDARQAQVVELRYFGGFTLAEAADLLGVSPSTAARDWTVARAWLQQALRDAS